MKQPLVSIIIPCYNAAAYIQRCLTSATAQTYENVEVLLIDDCGTDGTLEVIENLLAGYQGKIPVRIIRHEHNKGVSSARNTGIQEAKGEYIYFLDSDDSITPDCIETLLKPAIADNSIEMVVGNYKIIGPLYFDPLAMPEQTYGSDEIIKAQFTYKLYGMPWNKLIKKDFILRNHLFFIVGIIHEDVLWNYYCAMCLDKLYVVLKHTYNYYVHPGSITTSDNKKLHQEQRMKGMTHLLDYIFNGTAPDKKDVRNNPVVYKHIEEQLKDLLMDPLKEGNPQEARRRYHLLRQQKGWGITRVMRMKDLKTREKTRYLHHLLPEKLGFEYYKKRYLKHHDVQPETYNMKLSIITINYNNLDGLKRTIPSITSQTYTGYEFIVVDGGSTDGSKEYIASQERIDTWVSEPDEGIYNAMNKAVGMAHGEYCLFMNSGDTFFSAQVLENCIDRLGTYDYICGRSVYMERDKAYPFIPPQTMNIDFMLSNALCHQSQFTRTEVLRKLPFNEQHRIVSDWEQFFKGWFVNDCTFAALEIFVSIFYLDGISGTNKALDAKERHDTILEIIAESGTKGKTLQKRYNKFLAQRKGLPVEEEEEEEENTQEMTPKRAKRLKYKERLREKVGKALNKRSPIQRDLSVVKYGLKYFFKDLFA